MSRNDGSGLFGGPGLLPIMAGVCWWESPAWRSPGGAGTGSPRTDCFLAFPHLGLMGSGAWAAVPIDGFPGAGIGLRQWIFRMSRGPLGMPTGSDPMTYEEKLMAIWGADVEQLRTLGTKLQAGSSEIEQQRSNLTSLLDSTVWEGPDAEKFRSEWNGQHVSRPGTRSSQALQDAGQKATTNASEQERLPR